MLRLIETTSKAVLQQMLTKVARRISDGQVLAMVKQFLDSTGTQGVPQGSPLSPLLANLALNDLDHMLDRGSRFITYARYLDDMVVRVPDSETGRAWADRALTRIRCEADAIGVSLNTEKTHLVTITDEHAVFAGASRTALGGRLSRAEHRTRWSESNKETMLSDQASAGGRIGVRPGGAS